MKGRAASMAPAPSAISCRAEWRLAVGVRFGLADLPLRLPFHLLRLALDLLAGVAGQAADRVADLSADLLRRTLALVLEAVRAEIVCHDFESSWRWKSCLKP